MYSSKFGARLYQRYHFISTFTVCSAEIAKKHFDEIFFQILHSGLSQEGINVKFKTNLKSSWWLADDSRSLETKLKA